MMAVYIVLGDLLKSEEDILIHQVNCQGVMNAGVAKQIRWKYPIVYDEYIEYCKGREPSSLLGSLQPVKVSEGKFVVNVFSQLDYGRENKRYTSYDVLYDSFKRIKESAQKKGLSVALPYGMGCGFGGANWEVVLAMLKVIFKDYRVSVYKI